MGVLNTTYLESYIMLLSSGFPTPVIIITILFFALGYLIGSIPFGLLFAKLAGHGDIREIGSGNIGATNVLRTGNKKLAALTLFADILKGLTPVLLVRFLLNSTTSNGFADSDGQLFVSLMTGLAGFGAFIGHLYPFWLKFKGGKGVATFLGVLFGYYWVLGIIFALAWLVTAYISRISSFSALTASLITLLTTFFIGTSSIFITAMTALIYWKHRDNITRLMEGTESRIGKGK